MSDAVDPKHYQHGAYETIIKMIAILGPEKTKAFCDGCVFKYTDRMPFKGTPAEDLEKVDVYTAISLTIDPAQGPARNAAKVKQLLDQMRKKKTEA